MYAALSYITWSLNRLSRKCSIYGIIDPIPTIPSMCVCVWGVSVWKDLRIWVKALNGFPRIPRVYNPLGFGLWYRLSYDMIVLCLSLLFLLFFAECLRVSRVWHLIFVSCQKLKHTPIPSINILAYTGSDNSISRIVLQLPSTEIMINKKCPQWKTLISGYPYMILYNFLQSFCFATICFCFCSHSYVNIYIYICL